MKGLAVELAHEEGLVVRANDKHPQVNAAWGFPSRDRNPAAVNRR